MSAYEFKRPTELRFHGGRWDGLSVKAFAAPELLILNDAGDDHFGLMPIEQNVHSAHPEYERRSSVIPPINYVAR